MSISKQEINKLNYDIESICNTFDCFKIQNKNDYNCASDKLKFLKDYLLSSEDKRKLLVKPLNDHVELINSLFKPMTSKLHDSISNLKWKMLEFYKENNPEGNDSYLGRSAESTTYVRKMIDFEVVNLKEVPFEYLDVNNTRVRKDLSSGVRNIPGLLIHEKDVLVTK